MTKMAEFLRKARMAGCAVLLTSACAMAVPLHARANTAATAAEIGSELAQPGSDLDLRQFYLARGHQPLWLEEDGDLNAAARAFLRLAETASADGVAADVFGHSALLAALRLAAEDRSPFALARAELGLSRAFASYVRATRQAPHAEMIFVEDYLRPAVPTVRETLERAAAAPSLRGYVEDMAWMHPLYAPLRRALAAGRYEGAARLAAIRNLDRIKALPADTSGRYVIVDAANARLWMYENGRPVDSMKVVVGKPDNQTPMMAGTIRQAILNPYWNVPTDLVSRNIAPNVLRRGIGYLRASGYEVLSDWGDNPDVVDPATIDWREVARGPTDLRVRQVPRANNAMGKVKFEFPNEIGIFLHDTPDRDLMLEEARQFSSGCIRLEDADRLGRWLLGSPLPQGALEPEQPVALPRPVPIYVTYLTARAEGDRIVLGRDPYRLDSVPSALAVGN
jgi:L,D-transpeptidase YcbB